MKPRQQRNSSSRSIQRHKSGHKRYKPGDLYGTLGVSRKATPEEIHKAYRREAAKHHPDRGGDRARFEQAQVAYEVLMDPERREQYDRTGTINGKLHYQNQETVEILNVLNNAIAVVVPEILKQEGDVTQEDMVKHVRTTLNEALKELNGTRFRLQALRDTYKSMVERFEVDDGEENFFKGAVRFQQQIQEQELRKVNEEVLRIEKTLKWMKKARYKVREVMDQWSSGFTTMKFDPAQGNLFNFGG